MGVRKLISAFTLISASFLYCHGTLVAKDIIPVFARTISLNSGNWKIAVDSMNEGREKGWFKSPPASESRVTAVPWVIQDVFHNYHGVAWYWREFDVPVQQNKEGRYLLRFAAVDYLAEIWVNGKYAGGHEGSETPFDLDITELVKQGEKSLLVVRVLNPKYEPVDGISLKDTPSGAKQYPFTGNAAYNSGGIIGDVELIIAPAIRVNNVFVIPEWKTGNVKVHAEIFNAGSADAASVLSYRVTDAHSGSIVLSGQQRQLFKKGSNATDFNLQVKDHRLWCPEEPIAIDADILSAA